MQHLTFELQTIRASARRWTARPISVKFVTATKAAVLDGTVDYAGPITVCIRHALYQCLCQLTHTPACSWLQTGPTICCRTWGAGQLCCQPNHTIVDTHSPACISSCTTGSDVSLLHGSPCFNNAVNAVLHAVNAVLHVVVVFLPLDKLPTYCYPQQSTRHTTLSLVAIFCMQYQLHGVQLQHSIADIQHGGSQPMLLKPSALLCTAVCGGAGPAQSASAAYHR